VVASVAVLLALVVVGVVVDVLVARHLNRSLDRTLRQRAVEVAQLSASAPALLTSPGALDAPLGGQQLEVQVVDRRGRLVARSLTPLGRLARAAAEIERTGDPSRRLPEPASGDELVGLARTLNAMLASLERAREAERRFLADASHELRTPLTALLGNVAYLA